VSRRLLGDESQGKERRKKKNQTFVEVCHDGHKKGRKQKPKIAPAVWGETAKEKEKKKVCLGRWRAEGGKKRAFLSDGCSAVTETSEKEKKRGKKKKKAHALTRYGQKGVHHRGPTGIVAGAHNKRGKGETVLQRSE